MLLKLSDSWGPNLGLILLGVLVGGAAVLTALVWGLSNLFRRKSRKKSWAGLGIFLAVLAIVALLVFIIVV